MPRTLIALLAASILALPAMLSAGMEDTIIFLVRHAEKTDRKEDPVLTVAGENRARELAGLLADSGITGIHSTDYARTRETANPLAERLALAVQLYDPAQPDLLIEHLKETAGRQLVIGHSNTIPDLVGRLGGTPGPAIDEKSEHDRLYVVTLGRGGAVSTVLLRYGKKLNP